jgi:serine/threonine protein kinase
MSYPAELKEFLPDGDYIDVQLAGRGGTGSVYRATDKATGKPVAIKLLRFQDPTTADRTVREIKIMRGVAASPHVAQLLRGEVAPNGESALLMYEWVDGHSLERVLEENKTPLTFAEWSAVAVQLCDGLVHLHRGDVLHRDVKPSNVLLAADGVVKLADFGLAVISSENRATTVEGTFVGTFRYAPPEVISGGRPTAAVDTYAFGMTVLTMVLGRPPLPDSSLPVMVQQILSSAVLREFNGLSLHGLDDVLKATLALKPEDRPNLEAVANAIRGARAGLGQEREVVRALVGRFRGSSEAPPLPTPVINQSPAAAPAESVPGMLKSLANQVHQMQAAVSDMTARFSIATPESRDEGLTEIELAVRSTFAQLSRRLGLMWKTSLVMTCVLFSLFVVMVILAAVMGLVYKQSTLSLVFGAGSAASVFTVILWRPIDKMLMVTVATQQLDLVKINFQRALNGSAAERREAFKDVSAQLEALLERVMDAGVSGTKNRRKSR